jgi:hypothetical protein
MAINGFVISVSDPGAVPGGSTSQKPEPRNLKLDQDSGFRFLASEGAEIGSTSV